VILFALGLIVGASIGVIVFGLLTARTREYEEARQYVNGFNFGRTWGDPLRGATTEVPPAFTKAFGS
jgi:hypothetical protein